MAPVREAGRGPPRASWTPRLREAQTPRRFTIDAESIFGPIATESETRITLPEGWRARLPKSIHAKSEFGEFHSEYAQEGRVLVIRRVVLGARSPIGQRAAASTRHVLPSKRGAR